MNRTALLLAAAVSLGVAAVALTLFVEPRRGAAPESTSPSTGAAIPPTASEAGSLELTATLSDAALLAGSKQEVFLRLDLRAADPARSRARLPVNLVLVLDRSGSMAGTTLSQCKRAARQLVAQLEARDRMALVTFGSDVTTLVPSAVATPAAKQQLEAAIESIVEMGGTNLSGALEAGIAEARRHARQFRTTRLLLLSDGRANEGISDREGLAAIAARAGGEGVTISTIGIGLEFDEVTLESLAAQAGGAYHFLDELEKLGEVFGAELQAASDAIAVNPVVTIVPSDATVIEEVYGWDSERAGAATTVRLPNISTGQSRCILLRLAVTADRPGDAAIARVGLSYLDLTRDRVATAASAEVAARVTADPAALATGRDARVTFEAVHAAAVQSLRTASASYSAGRPEEAARLVQEAKTRLQAAGRDFGPSGELEQATAECAFFEKALESPAASREGQRAIKRIHLFSSERR